MEPEFNKSSITVDQSTQHAFASIISSAISNIKVGLTNVFFSLSMMDT